FTISRSPTSFLLAIPLSYLATGWVSEHGSPILATAGISTSTAVWSGLVGIWVMFGLWYLTTPRVSPVGWNRAFLWSALGSDVGAQMSRGAAVGLYLTGQRRLHLLQGTLVITLWAIAI